LNFIKTTAQAQGYPPLDPKQEAFYKEAIRAVSGTDDTLNQDEFEAVLALYEARTEGNQFNFVTARSDIDPTLGPLNEANSGSYETTVGTTPVQETFTYMYGQNDLDENGSHGTFTWTWQGDTSTAGDSNDGQTVTGSMKWTPPQST
jgi:hypothetical protein